MACVWWGGPPVNSERLDNVMRQRFVYSCRADILSIIQPSSPTTIRPLLLCMSLSTTKHTSSVAWTRWLCTLCMKGLCNSTYRCAIYLCEGDVNLDLDHSKVEYADIHFMYGKANCYELEAARLYVKECPHRRRSDRQAFIRIHQRFRENGSFAHHPRPGGPSSMTPDVDEHALERVDVNPGMSITRVAMPDEIILHSQLLYPYHMLHLQVLKSTDFLPILNF
ncbi:hypothetical protein PR048_016199 [Dryococelus australis]|uniref:Uncharacterized protein n=1 Tax=Dryococelus australis TaxID=614101 RepID=A0ABQ9HJ26_9NEOP|nr:hypothetical protein PR048_016199 [Dryococelus australis]